MICKLYRLTAWALSVAIILLGSYLAIRGSDLSAAILFLGAIMFGGTWAVAENMR